MFFGPKLPVSAFEKVSLEMDFQRVLDCFGIADLHKRKVLLPHDPLLALRSVENEADAFDLKRRIAEIFGLEDNVLGLVFFEDDGESVPSLQDHDGQSVAHIPSSLLRDKVRVASYLATGFATYISSSDKYSSQQLHVEFVAMWYGFGPIMAEAAVMTSAYTSGEYSEWSISKHGWLSAIQLGYAMAVREYLLGNELPDWHKNLVIDSKDSLVKGMKFLTKTNNCLVDEGDSCLRWDHSRCEKAMSSKFVSQRLAALEYFPAHGELLNDDEFKLAMKAIDDKDDFVRAAGYQLLEFASETTPELVRAIEIGLDDRNREVQIGAIRASAMHGSSIGGLGYGLQLAIESNDAEKMASAAASMAANELCGEKELKLILEKLRRSLVRGTNESTSLIEVLNYVCEDPKQIVIDYFADEEDLQFSATDLFPNLE